MRTKLQRLLKPLFWGLGALTTLVMLGFVERSSDRMPVTDLRVEVTAPEDVRFILTDDVRRRVLERNTGLIGEPMGMVDAPAIEEDLRSVACVASADAWHTLDGVLHVRVEQRRPIVRVINGDGSGFYIDEAGFTFPVSDAYSARVMVVTGVLQEPYAEGVHQVAVTDSMAQRTHSDEILQLARFIGSDPLWSTMIDQVVVSRSGEFELIPRIGMQRILIGDGSALEVRFARLREFYARGIPQAGWRKYGKVDVRFADQVVCTNRNM